MLHLNASNRLCRQLWGGTAKRLFRANLKPELPVPKFEKRLDVVIMGTPNAGKSVLLNQLISAKVAATSRKRHTTRTPILGVFNYRNTQLAFYDTPGYVSQEDAVKDEVKELREHATKTAKLADVCLIVVDAARCSNERYYSTFCDMVKVALDNSKKEIILILNKVDLVKPKPKLLEITRTLVSYINGIKLGPGKEHLAKLDTTTFMVSALYNDGLVDIKNYLLAIADIKPWVLSEEQGVTAVSPKQRVQEIVREKLLDHVHEEIPYIAEVKCISIAPLTRSGNRIEINVDIWVDSPGQQRIVVGQQGRTMVKIRQESVDELEKILGAQVILKLWIKVRSDKVNMHGGRRGRADELSSDDDEDEEDE